MRNLVPCLAALVLTLGVPPLASARIGGGKNALTDCYAEWDGVTASSSAKPIVVNCTDGDPTCDADGAVDGKCTFTPSLCVFQQDITGCTPVAITKLTVPKVLTKVGKNVLVPLGTPPSLTAPSCGNAAEIVVPTPKKPGASKRKSFSLVAKTGAKGKLKTDKNRLVLSCTKPIAPAASCPENAAGGPNKFTFVISKPGDLDNGNSGNSFSNPNVVGTVLNVCLKDCNTQSSPACTEDEAASNRVNGATFGAPLPLIASNVPVCVVNRYNTTKVSGGNIDFNTGQMSMTVNLLSDVVLTQSPNLCPICSGQNIGDKGKCDGTSTHAGLDCTVEGIITVGALNKRFTLSSQCPPKGVVSGTLTIPLAFTTGTSTLAGPKPCGESTDDQCGGNGPCTATGDTNDGSHPHCSGATTCASVDPDTGFCLDSRGGISQSCCAGNPNLACQPTAASSGIGSIVRQGAFTVPTPAVPDPTFPKCGTATLGAVFCESATSSNLVNTTTGLPGPGAILLPVKWQVKLSSTTTDCP